MSVRAMVVACAGLAAGLLVSGCETVGVGSSGRGDVATWEVRDLEAVTPDSRSVEIGVTRLGCASGITGEVLSPR